jgi:hypothetical protein
LSARITAEESRAKTAEQTNATAITAEVTRAQTAEAGLATSVMAEETRAKSAESALNTLLDAEESRAKTAEQALAQSILDNAKKTQADWNETDVQSVTYIYNKPAALPASDVYPWAKTLSKPAYTTSEIGAEPAFNKNTAFNKNFGSAAGTVCEGNDGRLTNSRAPTAHTHGNSDLTGIAAWAKAASKPSYTYSEVGAEPAFSKNTAFNKNFGTVSGTVCDGADSRLSNSRPASDVYAWAKAAGKPSYTYSEVGAEAAFTKNTAFNKNFGTAAGTVCEGNDYRLSNARTPTSHASSGTTYGAGDATYYGHVKLSSTDGTTSSGDTALRYNYSTAASDINLNNFVYEGRFTLYNVPISLVDTTNNFPTGWDTGSANSNTAYLEVRRFYNITAVHQTLYKRATTQRWVRVLASGIWSAWKEVDNAAINAVPNTRTVNGKALSANITLAGTDIGITANTYLGGATTVQAALNYIASVFAGTQRVTKLVASNFDT